MMNVVEPGAHICHILGRPIMGSIMHDHPSDSGTAMTTRGGIRSGTRKMGSGYQKGTGRLMRTAPQPTLIQVVLTPVTCTTEPTKVAILWQKENTRATAQGYYVLVIANIHTTAKIAEVVTP